MKANGLLVGVSWMSVSLLSFVGMAVSSRELAESLSIPQMLFFRSLVGAIVISPFVWGMRENILKGVDFYFHVLRNGFHFAGQYLWAVGVTHLPLVMVFALEFTTPIWVALLAICFLNEKMNIARVIASLCGFVGVLVVLRPGFDSIEVATYFVLFAAVAYAASIVIVKRLVLVTSPTIIVFWMVMLQLPLGLIFSFADWRVPGLLSVPWIVCLGVTGLSAHFAMAKALKIMDASVAMPIDFFRVPLIAVIGYFCYGENLSGWVFLGGVIIFLSNYFAYRYESSR